MYTKIVVLVESTTAQHTKLVVNVEKEQGEKGKSITL